MQFLFTRQRHVVSAAIRAVTWSEYSHVDAFITPATIIGSAAFEGVTVSPVEKRVAKASRATIVTIPLEDEIAAREFLISQVGKPYDWGGAFGVWARRSWQRDDAWFCSELVAAAVRAGGRPLFDNDFRSRITPQDLILLDFAKERIK